MLYLMLIKPHIMKSYGKTYQNNELLRYKVANDSLRLIDEDKLIYEVLNNEESFDFVMNTLFLVGTSTVLITEDLTMCDKILNTINELFIGALPRDIVWYEQIFDGLKFDYYHGYIQYKVITNSGKSYMCCNNIDSNISIPRKGNLYSVYSINNKHMEYLNDKGYHVTSFVDKVCKLLFWVTRLSVGYLIGDKFGFNIFEKLKDNNKIGLIVSINGEWKYFYNLDGLLKHMIIELMKDNYALDNTEIIGTVSDKLSDGLWVVDRLGKRITFFRAASKYDVIGNMNDLKLMKKELNNLELIKIDD